MRWASQDFSATVWGLAANQYLSSIDYLLSHKIILEKSFVWFDYIDLSFVIDRIEPMLVSSLNVDTLVGRRP